MEHEQKFKTEFDRAAFSAVCNVAGNILAALIIAKKANGEDVCVKELIIDSVVMAGGIVDTVINSGSEHNVVAN